IYGVTAVVTAVTREEILWLFLAGGLLALFAYEPPRWARRFHSANAVAWSLLGKLLYFFGKAGACVFGSGLAIVPFLYGGVVKDFHWLSERQFIDAVAVSMITPGPVVITVAFIGYLVAGLAGAILAAVGVFLPVYLITVLLAPHFHRV